MAGIYIHIPFCKQACYYCNFHFSTLLTYKERVVQAIAKELFLRKEELQGEKVETVYFGGGTPSLLSEKEFGLLTETLYKHFDLSQIKEFTLEANPDDINVNFLSWLKTTPVNRFSLGIQSFKDEHLKFMNRAHNAREALESVKLIQDSGFRNISIDLIYGIPGMSKETWDENLTEAMSLEIQHISSYCLTIEPQTVFGRHVAKNKMEFTDDAAAAKQYEELISICEGAGFEHYEISNFGKPGHYSLHNTNYWKGIAYLGAGPGAHSFSPGKRMWNVSNNQHYLKSVEKGVLPMESETLGIKEQFNEFIMTGLRTKWGINLGEIEYRFGKDIAFNLKKELLPYIQNGKLNLVNETFILSNEGKFFADGIAAAAFLT